jgi:hypothetical protein
VIQQLKPSFEVSDFFPYKDGFVILGRCMGGAVKVGDVFRWAVQISEMHDGDKPMALRREVLGELQLEVVEIQYFRQVVRELRDSQSGGIYVHGNGMNYLRKGCELEP